MFIYMYIYIYVHKLTKKERERDCRPILIQKKNHVKSVRRRIFLFVTSDSLSGKKILYVQVIVATANAAPNRAPITLSGDFQPPPPPPQKEGKKINSYEVNSNARRTKEFVTIAKTTHSHSLAHTHTCKHTYTCV